MGFIEDLIKNNSPILHDTDEYGNTILHPMVSMFSTTFWLQGKAPSWWKNEKFYNLTEALLYDIGVDANKQNKRGSIPLHWIDPDKVNLVMNKTDDVNVRDDSGNTPVFNHLRHNGISPLLDHPSLDVKVKNERLQTPLHWAASFCRPELVQKLLDRGADETAVNKWFLTPIEEAYEDLVNATEDEDDEEIDLCEDTIDVFLNHRKLKIQAKE